jgi:hypothetical protein
VVAGHHLDERRLLGALVERERAPVPEPAPGRRLEQRRRLPRDPAQPLPAYRTPTSGSEEMSICVAHVLPTVVDPLLAIAIANLTPEMARYRYNSTGVARQVKAKTGSARGRPRLDIGAAGLAPPS